MMAEEIQTLGKIRRLKVWQISEEGDNICPQVGVAFRQHSYPVRLLRLLKIVLINLLSTI